MSEPSIEQRTAQYQSTAQVIIATWQQDLQRAGLATETPLPDWQQATLEMQRDPASGESALSASWRGSRGELRGSMVFHGDGSFFAEYDVLHNHPKRSGWFIEAVTAWGRDSVIKSELRLLPLPE